MSTRILLVEDAPDVQMVVQDLLSGNGYEVVVTGDGNEALHLAQQQQFDLLILDVMLPGRSGFELCHIVRQGGFDGGILMLTARAQVDDRVQGLSTGADDYLIKPFDSKELVARVGALLRRVVKRSLTSAPHHEFDGFTVDFERRTISRGAQTFNLAAKELLLLRQLIDNGGKVLSRDQLLSRVWHGQPFIGPRTVDVHIAWLRQKLEQNPQAPRHILTVRGEGYLFQP